MAQDFTRKQVAALERRYDFKTAKSLGQNFVTDPSVTEAIIEAAGAGPKDLVLEIGPGLGVITSKAAQRCGRLVAIEVDKKLLPILAETVGWQPNVKIINEDILQADLEQIVAAERTLPDGSQAEHVRLIGNLPYYITTPILNKLMALPDLFTSLTIMVQKTWAQPVTQEDAKQIAAQFLKRQYERKSTRRKAPSQTELTTDVLFNATDAEGQPYLYVVSTTRQDGFVLVSGDERFADV